MILEQLKEKGYSGLEVCFHITLKRKGVMKLLENLKILKPKVDYYVVGLKDLNRQDVLMGNMNPITNLSNIKINGLR